MNQSYFIKGFPDYRLVRLSESKFCVLSNKKGYWEEIGSCDKKGHIHVCLASGDIRRYTYVHVLVAETFVPNPEGKPIVHHKDFDATNNDPANLMFVTRSEHAEIHANNMSEETRKKIGNTMKGRPRHEGSGSPPRAVEQWSLDDTTLIARYESMMEAERQTGIDHRNIQLCCKGKRKSAGGYKWRYAD